MPGKSKKGGGLESSPIYKKQSYGEAKSPFMMKGSPFKQAIGGDASEAVSHWNKYKKNKAWKKSFDKWMTGVIKRGGTTKGVISNVAKNTSKKVLGTIGAYIGSMGTAKATQPGTGGHGGKKIKTYDPTTGTYR